ncbi:hypothetical protein AFLA_007196 [Aspergillus flavus NRRL3357]|nr:hypothetical protein AFLA_007196 [Aspergillus flavus NRRL3357]
MILYAIWAKNFRQMPGWSSGMILASGWLNSSICERSRVRIAVRALILLFFCASLSWTNNNEVRKHDPQTSDSLHHLPGWSSGMILASGWLIQYQSARGPAFESRFGP